MPLVVGLSASFDLPNLGLSLTLNLNFLLNRPYQKVQMLLKPVKQNEISECSVLLSLECLSEPVMLFIFGFVGAQ